MPIEPTPLVLTDGQAQQLTLIDPVGNPVAGVQWSTNPAGVVNLGPQGLLVAPPAINAESIVTVIATPPDAAAEQAVVRLVPLEVLLVPEQVSLREGETQTFRATVPGVPGHPADVVQWSWAPALGAFDPASGIYTAPAKIGEDREVQVIATSVIDGHKRATASISLQSRPPGGWIIFGLFAYLVAIFSLVVLLIGLWPPSPSSVSSGQVKADSTQTSGGPQDQKAGSTQTSGGPQAQIANQDQDDRVETLLFKPISREVDTLWLVLIAGALGSFTYGARSFVDFVGNRALRSSWSAWYLMYPLIGAALALIFYLAVRGGFLTTNSSSKEVNIFGLTAIAGLVGMFSKQATTKLAEVFSTMFKTDKEDQPLKDKLSNKPPEKKPS